METTASSPSLHILVREPEGFSLWNGPPFANGQPGVKLERTPCTSTMFSTDRSRLMVIRSDSMVGVYDCSNFKEIRNFEIPNLAMATLSPCGTYLQTFQKSSAPQEKNVILWKVESGESVYQLLQKNITKTTCSDEAVVCQLATNEIQFFDGCHFSKGFKYRLRVPGVAAAELSKTPGSHVAAFVPESKRSLLLRDWKEHDDDDLARSMFHTITGDEGFFLNALILGSIPIGCSFIEETNRQALRLYIVGRIQAFWDYREKKQLGTTKAEYSVTSEWSPNGCYFMTATTAPRLQIDNCIKIFHHNGSLFFRKMFDQLYQAKWKPESPKRFCEVAELIKSVDSLKVEERKPQGQTAKSSQNSAKVTSINMPAQKPAAYRPPQAKNAAAVHAELFGESSSETLSKNALRNKKKREKGETKREKSCGGWFCLQ